MAPMWELMEGLPATPLVEPQRYGWILSGLQDVEVRVVCGSQARCIMLVVVVLPR